MSRARRTHATPTAPSAALRPSRPRRAGASRTAKKDDLMGKARGASPGSVSEGATQATQIARENPLPVAAIGAFAGGFLLGRLTKRT